MGSSPGLLRRVWQVLSRPSAKWSLLALLSTGFVGGIIFWGGFNTAMEATNTLEFCTSCHEMRDTVYAEYKETIHFSQPHRRARRVLRLPRAARLGAQDGAARSRPAARLYGKVMGTIDTQGQVRGQACRTGRPRVEAHEGHRFAGVPQLPQRRGDELRASSPRRHRAATRRALPTARPASIATTASPTRSPTDRARRNCSDRPSASKAVGPPCRAASGPEARDRERERDETTP